MRGFRRDSEGLVTSAGLGGQWTGITACEELMFPIKEKYKRIPHRAMWGVDDQIRELLVKALDALKAITDSSISEVKERFEALRKSLRYDLQGRIDP